MIVKAKETVLNAYDQALFMEGKEYKATDARHPKAKIYVFNELHTETPFTRSRLESRFEVVSA